MILDLTETEYDALKNSIREAGRIFVPVVLTSDGEVIDGKGRVRAAEELKITDYPREVVHGLDAEGRRLHRLSLNCVRRHLTTEQKREVVRSTLRSTPDLSNNYLGELTGVDGKTVAAVRAELEETSTIPKLKELRGKDGKTRPRYAIARNAREQADVAEALQTLGEAAPPKLLTARDVVRKAKRMESAASEEAAKGIADFPPDALVEIHECDFRQMPVAPGSAKLIFTDPLYHREHLPLYSALGEWAARVLQPGGLLVTYLGTSYLPEVIGRLGQYLEYFWTCSSTFSHETTAIYDHKIRTSWKPLLLFSKGPYQPTDWFVDAITTPKEKDLHVYQQPEVVVEFFVQRLTGEQALVLDPFCGSGTTAAVCKRLNRRCVTTDIDPNAVAVARGRVGATKIGDPLVRPMKWTGYLPMDKDDFEYEEARYAGLPA